MFKPCSTKAKVDPGTVDPDARVCSAGTIDSLVRQLERSVEHGPSEYWRLSQGDAICHLTGPCTYLKESRKVSVDEMERYYSASY